MSIFGENIRLPVKMSSDKLVDCAAVHSTDFRNTGLVALNAVGRFLYIPDITAEGGQLKSFNDTMQISLDYCRWGVAQTGNLTRLFVLSSDRKYFYQNDMDGELLKISYATLNFNKFINLAISIGGIYLALLTDKSVIIATTGDANRITIEHKLDCEVDDKCCLYWLGSEAVALFRPSFGLTVFQLTSSETHNEMLEQNSYFVPEIDGLRIISRNKHDFMHAVPSEVSEVLALGSQSPATYLYEASKLFRNKSPTSAMEYLNSGVRIRLEEAVSRCTTAALFEYKPELQKQLLEAANLGRCLLLSTSSGRISWKGETQEMV